MGTSIDDLITALRTEIPTYVGFTDKTEVLNAYSIADNPNTYIDNGWGLVIEGGIRASSDDPVNEYFSTTERNIGVVLCRSVFDPHGMGLQISDVAVELFEDAATIRDNFLELDKFGVLRNGENVIYSGDSGVNFLAGDDGYKFIYTQIDFSFDIIETINRS